MGAGWVIAVAAMVGGCVDKQLDREIATHPLFEQPPGTQLLWRDGSPPRDGMAPGWNAGGNAEVVWTSTQEPAALASWYETRFEATYQLRRSEQARGIRLDGYSADRKLRVLVLASPKGPLYTPADKRAHVAPPGTRTWTTVHVDRNPHR